MKTFETLVAEARDISSTVALAAGRINSERRIPEDVVQPMIDAGFFRLLLPRSLGGSELDHPDFLKIVSIFAQADASVGWCINQNNVFSTNAVRISAAAAEEVWGDPQVVVTNGPPTRGSKAVETDNGYLLSGRWDFSSGISHASWVAALAPVYHADGTDAKTLRTFLIPKHQVEVVDEWYVGGLRGTASLSFKADAVFVPDERAYGLEEPSREPGPLYVIHTTPMFASGFATVALGVARTGIDSTIELTKQKVAFGTANVLSVDSTVQRAIGEAEASWNSARAFLEEATKDMWHAAVNLGELPTDERIRVRLAGTHAIRTAADVVNAAYTLSGSSAIFESSTIQRCFDDVHAIRQQIQGRPTHYETAGQFFLGMEPRGIY